MPQSKPKPNPKAKSKSKPKQRRPQSPAPQPATTGALTGQAEDYLKAIYELEQRGSAAAVSYTHLTLPTSDLV